MAYYTYPVYVLASLIVFILCIIFLIYFLHLYNCLKSRVIFIRVQEGDGDPMQFTSTTADLFPVPVNRVYKCLGYVMFFLPSNLHQASSVLLCQCKLVKFKKVFLGKVKHANTIRSRQKEIEEISHHSDDSSDTENQLSILSIDNSLESEYMFMSNDDDETCLTEIVPSNDPFNSSCPICLEDFVLDEEIILLVCHHGYHKECLRSSLRTSASCPYCKSKSNMRTFRVGEEMPLLWQNLSRNNYGVNV